MDKSQLEQKISAVMDKNEVCSFATVEYNKPHVRYMVLFHEGLTIYLATSRKTHKIEELEKNPNVHIIIGFDGTWSSEILQISGTGKVTKDDSLRKKVWNEKYFKRWFESSDDPNYVILEITPDRIEYFDGETEPEIWEA